MWGDTRGKQHVHGAKSCYVCVALVHWCPYDRYEASAMATAAAAAAAPRFCVSWPANAILWPSLSHLVYFIEESHGNTEIKDWDCVWLATRNQSRVVRCLLLNTQSCKVLIRKRTLMTELPWKEDPPLTIDRSRMKSDRYRTVFNEREKRSK